MFDLEGRMLDNKSIQAMKAALPYLDIPVGSVIDIEGLLRAIRNFCHHREQKMIDMFLNFFMMKRMMSLMSMMNQMNQMRDADGSGQEGSMDVLLQMLKSQMPEDQQDMFDMVSMMMSSMSDAATPDPGDVVSHSDGDMADRSAEQSREEEVHDGTGRDFQEYASGESPDYPGAGDESEREGYEESGADYYGSNAEAEGSQPFVFPAGGFGPFRNLDKGHESGGETESGNDETGSEE